MIGSPLTAKEWNYELETTAGEAIVRVLMPFHEFPLRLSPPMPHLDKEVPAAMLDLGLAQAVARPVSRQAFIAAVDALPPHARRGADMGLVVGLAEAIDKPTMDLVERNIERTKSHDDVFRLLNASLLGAFLERADRDFGRLSNTGLRLGISQSLTLHVAALADGRPDLAAKAEPFTRMYRAGNWPYGVMKDGEFLVLVS